LSATDGITRGIYADEIEKFFEDFKIDENWGTLFSVDTLLAGY